MGRTTSEIAVEKKYKYYEKSVQNFEADLEFVDEQYEKIFSKKAKVLREDFGGTAALACGWTQMRKDNQARAIDLDSEPIEYGKSKHYAKLSSDEKERMSYLQENVLNDFDFKSDIICAFNFSYFIFKKRSELLHYFKQVHKGLSKEGMFFLDIFGGSECHQEICEETEFDNHSYYWDCDKYNPLTSEVLYYIHFKDLKKNIKYEKVFRYDWRMWTVVEIKELLEEAGFSEVKTFWEEDDDDGEGNGVFYESSQEDNCESWVTYIVGIK